MYTRYNSTDWYTAFLYESFVIHTSELLASVDAYIDYSEGRWFVTIVNPYTKTEANSKEQVITVLEKCGIDHKTGWW